nr:histidine acid phosphatase, eukaryotic [Tanacetum cinerariifolium]
GCGGTDFCPFEVFKEKIAAAHLKHSYDNLCNPNMEKQSECKSYATKFSELFSYYFYGKNKDTSSQKVEL